MVLKSKRIASIILSVFFLQFCHYEIYQELPERKIELPDVYRVYLKSSDRVLQKIACETYAAKGVQIRCTDEIIEETKKISSLYEVYYLSLEPQVRDSSSDLFRNNLFSLITFSTGAFVSVSAVVDYKLDLRNSKQVLFQSYISSPGRQGYYAFLPVYMGLISTNLGTGLNTYRRPDKLRMYCIEEEPDTWTKRLTQNRDEYCRDYENFLRDSFNRIEGKIMNVLRAHIISRRLYTEDEK
ncbi:MAG: hypothetical protein KDK45_09565 [Leptospiraceae bacterium]|nr:hypothetical protein [Leptospiraceae bacterium]